MTTLRVTLLQTVFMVGAMATGPGCANSQVRWIEGAPAAPGSGVHADPALASRPAATATPTPKAAPEPFEPEQRQRITQVQPWVDQAARTYALAPSLVHGVIWVESRHRPRAKSSAGARGLMQLMPATANAMARAMGQGRARVYDPEFNINAGSLYLSRLVKYYDGDLRLALAAYNAGAGNVNRWLEHDGELPPNSVRYVELVMDAQRRFEARRNPPPSSRPTETMLARVSEPVAVVPDPPPARPRKDAMYYDDELGPIPRHVVVPPEPSANEGPLPIEPPLADTPYPPNDDDFAPRTSRIAARDSVSDGSADVGADTTASQPASTGLPSVLD